MSVERIRERRLVAACHERDAQLRRPVGNSWWLDRAPVVTTSLQ